MMMTSQKRKFWFLFSLVSYVVDWFRFFLVEFSIRFSFSFQKVVSLVSVFRIVSEFRSTQLIRLITFQFSHPQAIRINQTTIMISKQKISIISHRWYIFKRANDERQKTKKSIFRNHHWKSIRYIRFGYSVPCHRYFIFFLFK